MKRSLQTCLLLVIVASIAQGRVGESGEITAVRVAINGNDVSIEVDLTSSISPTVSFAQNPDRLIADFPNMSPRQLLQNIPVGKNGVERVRVGLNHASPPVTRVVVDLDSLHPFALTVSRGKVCLKVRSATVGTEKALHSRPTENEKSTGSIVELPSDDAKTEPNVTTASEAELQPEVSLPTRSGFKIKGTAADSVYLDGGSNSGLQKGMKLIIRDSVPSPSNAGSADGDLVAELRIIAVATTSAVAEVQGAERTLRRGDWAVLTPDDARTARNAATVQALSRAPTTSHSTLMPAEQSQSRSPVSMETGGSRISGRIGLDYSGITSSGSTPGASTQVGMSFQSDMTRILGTHWNLQGYWRGRITRHSEFLEPTIEETLDKTYTMQMYYDNPESAWVVGLGRLYLPWAVSLDTIDGGYLGRKLKSGVTAGVFAGSTPDLTSWDYAPNHRIAGSFVNFAGGSFDGFHFSGTSGLGLSTLDWRLDRPFLFFENEGSYQSLISAYHSLIVDSPRGVTTDGIRPGTGVSHSYLTFHVQPSRRLSFDVYHNYFRDVPTAATRIVGTGLVDKLLFQGFNAGVHIEALHHVTVYTTLGRSEKTGDEHRSLNQMYGLTWGEILHTGMRADFHYSKFDSSFGRGGYRLLALSRQISNRTFWNVQLGTQNMISPFTKNTQSKFAATSLDLNMGKHSFLQTGYTFVTGDALNYRQWYSSLGFRLDRGPEEVDRNSAPR